MDSTKLEQSYQYMLSHFRTWGDTSEYGEHPTYHLHLTHNGSQEEVISFYSLSEINSAIRVLTQLKEKAEYQESRVGIEYHQGKPKPFHAFRLVNNKKTYIGWFAIENEAWRALEA